MSYSDGKFGLSDITSLKVGDRYIYRNYNEEIDMVVKYIGVDKETSCALFEECRDKDTVISLNSNQMNSDDVVIWPVYDDMYFFDI